MTIKLLFVEQEYLLPTQSDSDGTKTYVNRIKLKFPIRQSAKRA